MVFLDFDRKKNVLNSILHENEKKKTLKLYSASFHLEYPTITIL